MPKYISINGLGQASGSVWHSHTDCGANVHNTPPGNRREVPDDVITILGFTQCRQCERADMLEKDEILVKLSDALVNGGFIKAELAWGKRLTAARNLKRQLLDQGLQFVGEE